MIREHAILSVRLYKSPYLTLLAAILTLAVVSPLKGDSSEKHIGARSDVIDTDGDGLSDFQEIHKYLTDPAKNDTDGDGVPDGDWNDAANTRIRSAQSSGSCRPSIKPL